MPISSSFTLHFHFSFHCCLLTYYIQQDAHDMFTHTWHTRRFLSIENILPPSVATALGASHTLILRNFVWNACVCCDVCFKITFSSHTINFIKQLLIMSHSFYFYFIFSVVYLRLKMNFCCNFVFIKFFLLR